MLKLKIVLLFGLFAFVLGAVIKEKDLEEQLVARYDAAVVSCGIAIVAAGAAAIAQACSKSVV